MNIQKNGVQAVQSNSTPIQTQQNQVCATITQQGTQSQAPAKRKRDKIFDKCKVLAVGRATYTLAIKFYDEQIVNQDVQALVNAVRSIPKEQYHVMLVCHYKDEQNDGVWKSSLEKRHYHLIMRTANSKNAFRINTMLQYLNIAFRQGLDDEILAHGALETVANFSAYATYLTHDTEQAISDGKMRYGIDEIVSNLTKDEIMQVRDGYTRLCTTNKPTSKEMAELDEIAFNLGREMKNFDDWYNALPFAIRSHAKMKTVRESYERGVNQCVTEQTQVLRLCIFIQGEPNTGKTYTSKKVLDGKRIHTVSGGHTGKFDSLRPDHQAIIIDDDVCPNLLNMSDNYICRAYRRNKNNPVWSGEYLIITSNLTFTEYLESCGIKVYDLKGNLTTNYDALYSRFFVCKIKTENGVNRLAVGHVSNRGTREEQLERCGKFLEFQTRFDEIAKDYKSNTNNVDFSDIEEDLNLDLGYKVTNAELMIEYNAYVELYNNGNQSISSASFSRYGKIDEALSPPMAYGTWVLSGCPNTYNKDTKEWYRV